ncbi:uncharacterized protein PITG_06553 [Phytophthora infestans T30-4]|uniref:Uncharacterized protein n=1 Tax=Phytophthora infestans (strain T30-4) TaxID=403677 RepID=D0N541_PHYIT|nr:uncharacterized protein PITG_06553 [Phytophthora infestans T30-4]EEY69999.1 hypothetical protein PITG_06553 [Phytophthora infestans T30-4]|eukprot:XP_002998646.1 hypothetical protein PITG_06553 [Phytophthora infestans T30-4]
MAATQLARDDYPTNSAPVAQTSSFTTGYIKSFLRAASGRNAEARRLHCNNPYECWSWCRLARGTLMYMLTKKDSSSKGCGTSLETLSEERSY